MVISYGNSLAAKVWWPSLNRESQIRTTFRLDVETYHTYDNVTRFSSLTMYGMYAVEQPTVPWTWSRILQSSEILVSA